MKKSKIALASFICLMATVSVVGATAIAEKTMNLPQLPGINNTTPAAFSLETENCCGQKVPKGTCMAVCFTNHTQDTQLDTTEFRTDDSITKDLSETNDKISGIDMEKDFGEAKQFLDGFYTGSVLKKKDRDSVVYADHSPEHHSANQTAESICNAKPSKITLRAKVPPLKTDPAKDKNENSLPLGAGALAIGTIALAITARRPGSDKGYFDHYSDDVHTVVDYVTGGHSSGSGSGNNSNNSQASSSTSTANSNNYASNTSSATSNSNNSAIVFNPPAYSTGAYSVSGSATQPNSGNSYALP